MIDRADSLDTEIILICKSGNRSFEVANTLIKKGFNKVAHISGFESDLDSLKQRANINGWHHDNLPWEQC